MRTREERRNFRKNKIKKRESILKNGGEKNGTLYEKHINKVRNNGGGYMAKHGTLLHYANGTNSVSKKTRNRNSYDGTENWSYNDSKKIDSLDFKEKDN